ncbi:Hsp70 family protein [Actinomadura sp. NPDC000600]|uniref:Hsp70 family protein n=1 Tax=Actinomadura sp. NPDC000600 TaxID=3154262 RepID=UPI0033922B5E
MIASIDFGASSTKAAILDSAGGPPESVLFGDAAEFPTAVYLTGKGEVLVGTRAIRSQGRNPLRLGTELKQRVNHAVAGGSSGLVLRLGNGELPLVDGMAAVLRHALEGIRGRAAGLPGQLVLTHPVTWGDGQRALLREAAGQAGVRSVLHLVNEPEAAIRHVLAELDGDLPAPVAVLDVGASTSDLAVLTRRDDGRLVPLFQDGAQAGGDDLDAAVLDHVAGQLSASDVQVFTRLREEHPYEVWEVARQTKHELSALPLSGFSVEFEGMPDVPIRREGFQAATEDVVEECLAPLEHAIEVLRGTDPVRSVVLSGGTSLVPAVREEAKRLARTADAEFLWIADTDRSAVTSAVALGAVRTVPPYEIRMTSEPVFTLPDDANIPMGPPVVATKNGYACRSGTRRIMTYLPGPATERLSLVVGNLTGYLWSLAYDATTRTLISGTDDGLVETWKVGPGGELEREGYVGRVLSLFGFSRDQGVVALALRRNWAAWCERRHTGAIYQRRDGRWVRRAALRTTAPTSGMAFTDSPHRLVAWGGGHLTLFEPEDGRRLCSVSFDSDKDDFAVDPLHGRVYVAGGGTLTCYRVSTRGLSVAFEVPLPSSSLVETGRSAGGREAVLAYDPEESAFIAVDGLTGAVLARSASAPAGCTAMVRPVHNGLFPVLADSKLFRVALERKDA